jgi:hypothetical protein
MLCSHGRSATEAEPTQAPGNKAARSNGRQRPYTVTWEHAACGKLIVVQPKHPMAQAAKCGCYVGTVMIPAHASSMRRAIAQH